MHGLSFSMSYAKEIFGKSYLIDKNDKRLEPWKEHAHK